MTSRIMNGSGLALAALVVGAMALPQHAPTKAGHQATAVEHRSASLPGVQTAAYVPAPNCQHGDY